MSEFDKDIKVGDLITSYHKGIHKVTKIVPRFHTSSTALYSGNTGLIGKEYESQIYYNQVADAKGNPRKGRERSCDATYCKLAIVDLREQVKELHETISRLEEIIRNSP